MMPAQRLFLPLGCALASIYLAASCSRAPGPALAEPTRAPTTPAPAPAARRAPATATPITRIEAIRPAATPAPPVKSLEARYFAGAPTPEQREEVIRELGALGTPAAAEVLVRIFAAEKRLETRMAAFEVIFDLPDETCREQKFRLLQRGLAPDMAQTIRLGMVQMLTDFGDPRAPGLLRAAAADRDPAVRRAAAEALAKNP